MQVLVVGAGGMIGRKLVAAIGGRGDIGGRPVTGLVLADIVDFEAPPLPCPAARAIGDLSTGGFADALVEDRPELIFHLAAIVSGEAEEDFEKGYRVNLGGTQALLEAIRRRPGYAPRLVFASSLAVFGEPLPDVIPDSQAPTPLTSYGTQKAICELLLADYSRKGYVDGIGIRLPTISVRPGRPNKAASGFFSSILREPLVGQEAALPVGEEVRHWFASPRAAVGFLLHAAEIDTELVGTRRSLTMPGLSATVGDQIAALRRVAGDAAARPIRHEPDPRIAMIIAGWPKSFDAGRAVALGFRAEQSFDEIIRIHIEDELSSARAPEATA
jgi:nucleoside-diphosphate-sugar epimerase